MGVGLHNSGSRGVRIGPLLKLHALRKEITMELQRYEFLAQAAQRTGVASAIGMTRQAAQERFGGN